MQSLILKLQAEVADRKRARVENPVTLRGAALVLALFAVAYHLGARSADPGGAWTSQTEWQRQLAAGNVKVMEQSGEIDLQRAYIERLERIHRNSSKYGIGADLAEAIEDIALAEGIDPKLAFELVRVESSFNPRAVSPVGAVGYTQLMPATARLLSPGISRRAMFDRDTNLRLGFRFLRSLINHYDGNVRLALLAYNRGPHRVDTLIKQGINPNNGYARMVLGK